MENHSPKYSLNDIRVHPDRYKINTHYYFDRMKNTQTKKPLPTFPIENNVAVDKHFFSYLNRKPDLGKYRQYNDLHQLTQWQPRKHHLKNQILEQGIVKQCRHILYDVLISFNTIRRLAQIIKIIF